MSLDALLAAAENVDNSDQGKKAQEERKRLEKLQQESDFECVGCGS